MLACWNGEPQNRPTFTDLRSKFDAMLAAERKDAYIDLRIDSDKPYYRLDTMAMLAVNGAHLSPNLSHHNAHSKDSAFVNRSGSKECSPKPSLSPQFSPCHLSQDGCCSAQASPRKSDIIGACSSSLNHKKISPRRYTCEQSRRSSDAERRGRGRDHNSQGRPVSMLLPSDRERREKQNPYVEEPSRVAAITLAPPRNGGRHGHSGSDGAIEMRQNRFESAVADESGNVGIAITITGDETEGHGQTE